jgi:hypothetical protein
MAASFLPEQRPGDLKEGRAAIGLDEAESVIIVVEDGPCSCIAPTVSGLAIGVLHEVGRSVTSDTTPASARASLGSPRKSEKIPKIDKPPARWFLARSENSQRWVCYISEV